MTTREELREAARRLGAMMAEHEGDFYDIAEPFAQGYAAPLSAHLEGKHGHFERMIHCQISALNELRLVASNVIEWRVDDARDGLMSWQQIGDALDISRQAAHERFGRKDSE